MRKLILLFVVITVIFSLAACTNNNGGTPPMDSQENIDRVTKFDLASGTNGNAPTVRLSSGYDMPILGIGTYSLHGETCISAIHAALNSGVRKIDTATIYGNEEEVGEAIRTSGVPREDIFVTTKIYPNEYANAEEAIEESLARLDIGYVDLMLLHHPDSHDVKAYRAMENAVKEGKIRSLGVSNYYIKEINAFLPKVTTKPVLVQNEIHPYYQEKEVVEYMHNLGIVVEGWYPFGGRGYTSALLNNEVILEIAKAHGVTSAQVILRWNLQRGVVAIPGSSNPEHIKENISVFHFELSDEDMQKIAALERNEKHDWY